MRKLAILLVAAALCCAAVAQEKAAAKKPGTAQKPAAKKTGHEGHEAGGMPMPKPSPEMEKLSKMLVGTWTSSETHEPSPWMPKGGTGKGAATFKNGPGGLSVVEDYHPSGTMGGHFYGHGVFWWDAKAGGYGGVWCDNTAPEGCGVGRNLAKWQGNDLVSSGEEEMMGQKMMMKEAYTDITPNSFTFSMYGGPLGSEPKKMMTIKYTRAGGKTAEKKP